MKQKFRLKQKMKKNFKKCQFFYFFNYKYYKYYIKTNIFLPLLWPEDGRNTIREEVDI